MRYTGEAHLPEKIQTWEDNWNDAVRTILFPDERLKDLLLIPDRDRENIMKFITEYFVRFPMTDEVLADHKVRVIYDDEEPDDMNIAQAVKAKLVFDIFVKSDHLHDVEQDRLKDRAVLIADRIRHLLTRSTYVCGLRFRMGKQFGVGSRTIGYRRYRLVMNYHKTY